MPTTTIGRYVFTDDSGDGESGDVWNAALIATAIYDKFDAILANDITFGGILSGTMQPRAVAYHSTTQSLADSSLTAISLDSEDYDVGSMHSTSVNTSRMTCPSGGTGAYLVIGKVSYAANGTGVRVARLRKNGADVATQSTHAAVAGSTQVVQTTCVLGMVPGDYMELFGFQTSGGALNTGDASTRAIQNELTVIKIW